VIHNIFRRDFFSICAELSITLSRKDDYAQILALREQEAQSFLDLLQEASGKACVLRQLVLTALR
jgi:hypothetical protein